MLFFCFNPRPTFRETTSCWMLLKLGTGNGERGTGNECTAVTRLRIQNGGGNDVYKH